LVYPLLIGLAGFTLWTMNVRIASLVFLLLFVAPLAMAQAGKAPIASIKERLFDEEKGFFTCSGGSSSALFNQDCKKLTLDRVSFGGSIAYEALCIDSNNTPFFISCLAVSFERDKSMVKTDQGFFDR
jgi:hypothetical protein